MMISAAMVMGILPAFKAHYNRPLVNAPAAFFKHTIIFMEYTHKYMLFIKGNTIDEVIEETLHVAYLFLLRALAEHRRQGRNGDYEAFAVELLAMLQKYRNLYTTEAVEDPSEV